MNGAGVEEQLIGAGGKRRLLGGDFGCFQDTNIPRHIL